MYLRSNLPRERASLLVPCFTVRWTIQDEALFIRYTLQRMTRLTQPILVLSAYPTPTWKCQHVSHDSHILINLLKC